MTTTRHPLRRILPLFVCLFLSGLLTGAPAIASSDCKLQYPIVLSHHFGARKICPDDWTAAECLSRETDAVVKYCARWDVEKGCQQWVLPADEQHLPPRRVNASDPNLVRTSAAESYHRYFSKEIVASLEACGNRVFLSDKPPYASYQVRARSLRATLLEALEQTGADKVVLIGMSQGVQDARFMVAQLPVDDQEPARGLMRDKVVALVGMAGEHAGAESAALAVTLAYLGDYVAGAGWDDFAAGRAGWDVESGEKLMNDLLWRDQGNATTDEELERRPLVLSEGYDAHDLSQYGLTTDYKYRHFLHSVTNLTPLYMGSSPILDRRAWDALRSYLGMTESGWGELVNASNEQCNGVEYFSYGARIRRWDQDQWGDATLYCLMRLLNGRNDGYVTLASQSFDRMPYKSCAGQKSSNFRHVKTLDGQLWSHGYHHMFFSGRNAGDAPAKGSREPAPYDGNAAEFYVQVLRDLKGVGF